MNFKIYETKIREEFELVLKWMRNEFI
ncbi:ribosome-recycling factor, partial [Ureaplasma urealyticum]